MLEVLEHFMSTVVVVKKDRQIAIAADTLTKLDRMYESAEYVVSSSKILRLGENYIAQVGHASLSLIWRRHFAEQTELKLDSTDAIFDVARGFHKVLEDDYYLNTYGGAADQFESSSAQYLIANSYGIFGLYALRSVQEYSKFYSFGSGSEFALGAMEALHSLNFSSEEIARKAVECAAKFDDSTGLPVEIYTIKQKS